MKKYLCKIKSIRVGARIIKSALAITVSVLICNYLNLGPSLFAAITALSSVQPSVRRSFRVVRDQVLVHLVGVLTALGVGFLFTSNAFAISNAFAMGLSALAVIVICVNLGLKGSLPMGIVAALFVLDSPRNEFISHALIRSYVIFIGLAVGLTINSLIAQPRYCDKLREKLLLLNSSTMDYFKGAVNCFVELGHVDVPDIQRDRERLRELTRECRELYNLCTEQEGPEKYLIEDKCIQFSADMFGRGRNLYDLMPSRLARRESAGNIPYSRQFKEILSLVQEALEHLEGSNQLLRKGISGLPANRGQDPELPDEIWSRLSGAVEEWNATDSGSYHLHAMIDIISIVNELRWAHRKINQILEAGVPDKTPASGVQRGTA